MNHEGKGWDLMKSLMIEKRREEKKKKREVESKGGGRESVRNASGKGSRVTWKVSWD
jgi:hypothetical protein